MTYNLVPMSPEESPRLSFGRAIRSRRLEMGLTAGEMAKRGGPSPSSLNRLENDKVENPHTTTLQALDRILEWEPGTAQTLFYKGANPPEENLPPNALPIFEDEVVDLMTWNTLLAQHYEQQKDTTAAAFTQRITSITNALLGRWIDTTIENEDPAALRFLTNVVSNQPLVPPESPDYTDQLYRRWRLGIIPDSQLDSELLQNFLMRKDRTRR